VRQLLIILSLIGSSHLLGQTSFSASLDAQEVFSDSYVTVSFTAKNGKMTDFTPPDFKNFTVVQGPSTSTQSSIYNGRRSSETTISYVLKPKRTGKLNIGPATGTINGKSLKTKKIGLKVVKSNKKKKGSNPFFIETVLSDSVVYLGQQVIVDYIFYYTPDSEINSVRPKTEDDFDGFFATPITNYQSDRGRKIINGIEYAYLPVRKVALFPQNAGKYTLPPRDFTVFIQSGTRRSIFFNSFDQKDISTAPKNILVNPLPSNDPFFSGAVGNYFVSAKSNKTNISTDQSISLEITVFGDGDPKLLIPPTLSLTDSLEVYEPNFLREENYVDKGRQKHKSSYEYLILPKYAGRYSIKPSITYFNPDSNSYQRTFASPIKLNVTRGSNSSGNQETKLAERSDKMASFITDVSLKKPGWKFFSSIPFWLLLGLCLSSYPAIAYMKHKKIQEANIDPEWLKSQNASKVAEAKLAVAKNHLANNDQRSFYNEISKSILGYASDKIKIPASELSKSNIVEKLSKLEVNQASTSSITEILSSCEMALFAGSNEEGKMQSIYNLTLETLSDIEKQLS
jgi:hypothetical protein